MIKPELAILSSSQERLNALERDPRFSAKELERTLALDPALAIAVLQRAIHVHHRHIDSPITTLLQAAMMLGVSPIRKIAEELPIAESILQGPPLTLYKSALARAALSSRFGLFIAQERRELEPREIALSCMLAPLGELALWQVAPEDMCELERLRRVPGVHPQQAEYIVFGTGIGDLGRTLAEAWGLPELVQSTLRLHNALPTRQLAPLLASRLSWHALGDWQTPQAESDLSACAHHLSLDSNTLAQYIDEITGEFETDAAEIYDLSALEVIGGTQVRDTLPPTQQPIICLTPDQQWIKLGQDRLVRAKRPQDIIEALLDTIYRGLGMDRIVFARYEESDEGDYLEADVMLGTDYEYGFHRFRLAAKDKHLFALMLKRPAAVWLRGPEDTKLSPLVPSNVTALTGVDRFFCLSLFAGETPIGLIYADRRHPECALTEAQFATFKRLGALAAKRLGALAEQTSPTMEV